MFQNYEALCSEGSMFRRFYVPKVLCSEGSMFRRFYVPKVLCSEGSMFRRFYVPKVLCSEKKLRVLYSVGSIYIRAPLAGGRAGCYTHEYFISNLVVPRLMRHGSDIVVIGDDLVDRVAWFSRWCSLV